MAKKPTVRFYLNGRRASILRETTRDVEAHDKLKDILSYYRPGYRFSPSYRQINPDTGKPLWDGKSSMVLRSAISLGLLIGAEKEIRKAGLDLKIVKWDNRPDIELKKGFITPGKEYEYQNKCVTSLLHALRKGGGLVLSATGSGKTAMAAQLFSWIDGKAVFIVNRRDLMYQSQKELSHWLKEKVGIIGDSQFEPQRITVAMIQTLSLHRNKKWFRPWAKDIDVTFIDELHKQMGRRNFDIVREINAKAVIGLTATLQMGQKLVRWKVYSICGPVVFEYPIEEGQRSGVLSKAVVIQVLVP